MPLMTRDYTFDKGATLKMDFTAKSGATPYDLTGHHMRFIAWDPSRQLEAPLLDLDDQSKGGITLGGNLGTISVRYADELTATVKSNKLQYRLFIDYPDGTVDVFSDGVLTFNPGRPA